MLAFFVPGSGGCVAEVTALQTLSSRFPASRVQFAAVAVRTSHHDAAAAVRAHHWTIPVAYDPDGAVGEVYGVEVCPIVELASPGGRGQAAADRRALERSARPGPPGQGAPGAFSDHVSDELELTAQPRVSSDPAVERRAARV